MKKNYLLLCFLMLTAGVLQSQTKIFWGDNSNGQILSANLDGSNLQVIASGLNFPEGIDVDTEGGKVYFMDGGTTLNRMNLDGSNREVIISGLSSPDGVAIDFCARKVYFGESGTQTIKRANLDGTNVETVVSGADVQGVEGLAVDGNTGRVYWVRLNAGIIYSAKLDGTDIQSFNASTGGPLSLAKEMNTGKIYWTEISQGRIFRANPDGSNIELLLDLGSTGGISIDAAGGKMYFEERFIGIRSANLDGSGLMTLVTRSTGGLDLALDLPKPTCPAPAAPIPTMSEWGMLIFGLLVLNLGLIFVRRRTEMYG